jgi:asparagine synthase (glutamine-hydrolysing)
MQGITGWLASGDAIPILSDYSDLAYPGKAIYSSQSNGVTAVMHAGGEKIKDPSATGDMTMELPEERLAIIYEGEIYNCLELRSELEEFGESFITKTDAEIILRGYRFWGDAAFERLWGEFAFALWDGRGNGRMVLARDPLGKKALYFREERGKGLQFSSKLKTLVHSDNTKEVDPESLEYYLKWGFLSIDRCILKGYRKIPPGHFIIWENGGLKEHRCWDPRVLKRPTPIPLPLGDTSERLVDRLKEAVKSRVKKNGLNGILLSGGIESISLLTLMRQITADRVPTFTACFGYTNIGISEMARKTASILGYRNRAILITPRAGRLLPFIASRMDEPIADPSSIAAYLIGRQASHEVKSLLTAGGLDYFRPEQLVTGWPGRLTTQRFFRKNFSCHSITGLGYYRFEEATPKVRILHQTKLQQETVWNETLCRMDMIANISKAASLKIEFPFLDQRLIEWILAHYGVSYLSKLSMRKLLFNTLMEFIPPGIKRSDDQNYHIPINEWFRCEWRTLAQDVLLDAKTRQRGWINEAETCRLLEEHLSSKSFHGGRLYQLLILELWARSLLDGGEREPIPSSVDDCARELISDRPVRKVAVIAPAGIGDTMRLTPALRQLGATDPNVSVSLYVSEGRESHEIMSGLAPVDRHLSINFQKKTGLIHLIKDIRSTSPDQLVSTWVSKLVGLVGALSGVKQRTAWLPAWSRMTRINGFFWTGKVTYDPSQKDAGRYDAELFSQLLGVNPTNLMPIFATPIWPEKNLIFAKEKLLRMKRPILAVNAVAQAWIRQRQYPLDLMVKVLQELLDRGTIGSIILLGDGFSRDNHEPFFQVIAQGSLDLSGQLSLAATASLINDADAVLTIDGGLLHVALASNLPVVALFGPTEVYSNDPRGENGRYKIISAFPDCRCLCLNHRGIKVSDDCLSQAKCLASISPLKIVEALSTVLGYLPPREDVKSG